MYSQADLDNHANQLNPNNDAYWSSRGIDRDDDYLDDSDDDPLYFNDYGYDDHYSQCDYEDWCSEDFES